MCHQILVILGFVLLQYVRQYMLAHPTSRPTQQEGKKNWPVSLECRNDALQIQSSSLQGRVASAWYRYSTIH